MELNERQIMVSICCVTYNHENYIADALDGFLAQETQFAYEIIIGDDCSTDATREILNDYCNRNPGKIRVVSGKTNMGSKMNQRRTFESARGKYIAMCDGDDYWIDPLKLQKQVDFMESHPDSVICCHYSRVIDESGDLVYEHPAPVKLEFAYDDVLLGRREETRICSLMVRNNLPLNEISGLEWYQKTYGADTFLKLYVLAKEKGKIYVLPEVMSVYRLHRNGIWSLIDAKLKKERTISDFNILLEHFNYSPDQKKALRKIYIKKHLLFDIKNRKFQGALNTLKNLV